MSTQDQPSLWKWYVLKAVIAALILYAGYKVFIDKPSPEVPAPTQDELDALSGNIELIEEEPPIPEAKPEAVTGPAAETDPIAAVEQPVPNFVELVQPMDEMPEAIDGYEGVTFDKLASFAYEVPLDPVTNKVELAKLNAQIPESIKSLDKKSVAIRGFMLPLKVENGLVTELLVMRDQSMCCFGTVPKINEWINIRMAGDGVQPIMDQAITLMGQLKVGEVLENDYLVGIYEMEGDRMIGPLDL
ncbi:MAG: hypothetical protein CMO68_03160 [Verrucomicrobiales bacterium]|nr:hypothetical protein [Verrucomicrobiales bacterium]